ncbi:HvfX family Cu-binding RiPP maturation protein [Elizabethkingia anophelis]|uniref:HvfX family Cu-binding RiPP maturation protein n=1 Tax=Elizabethkingia anophelis TaxID=1117645 RepID=UPI00389270C6
MEKLDNYKLSEGVKGIPLLGMRLIMGYGFFIPGWMKLSDISANAKWFESINIPFPIFSVCLSGGIEMVGAVFLVLGLYVRKISIPLILVMFAAIFTVHIANGFQAANDGFEINLYYIIMLFTLIVYGPGKSSLDSLRSKYTSTNYDK